MKRESRAELRPRLSLSYASCSFSNTPLLGLEQFLRGLPSFWPPFAGFELAQVLHTSRHTRIAYCETDLDVLWFLAGAAEPPNPDLPNLVLSTTHRLAPRATLPYFHRIQYFRRSP
jgi:hypothetical protein